MKIQPKYSHGPTYNNTNWFEVLSQDIKCFVCQNFGHKAKNCRLKDMVVPQDKNQNKTTIKLWKQNKVCIEKHGRPKIEECGLSLQAHDKGYRWSVHNGCSRHMERNKTSFMTMNKDKEGSATFCKDNSSKRLGKGAMHIGNGGTLEKCSPN